MKIVDKVDRRIDARITRFRSMSTQNFRLETYDMCEHDSTTLNIAH